MVAFRLLLSTVGKDPIYGTERFTFHIFSLFDGLNIALLYRRIAAIGFDAASPIGGEHVPAWSATAALLHANRGSRRKGHRHAVRSRGVGISRPPQALTLRHRFGEKLRYVENLTLSPKPSLKLPMPLS